MKIYLDNCIIQDLKRPELSEFLDLIKRDKTNNVYCYSEAHLQDLIRDKSNQKFDDLIFMQNIVDSNYWHYNKKIIFEHIKPESFIETFFEYSETTLNSTDYFSEDLVSNILKEIFEKIPINFNHLIDCKTLPSDFPEELKKILEKPCNFYEYICAFRDISEELSTTQNVFKKLISYLHKNNFSEFILKKVGIEGFNGSEITDVEKFRETYTNFFLNEGKFRYNLFLDQYNGLEFFGFVKGKPRKQKMMNLINDGKHAFFGGFCDVIVSKDRDFLEKTKFIYAMHEIQTKVFDFNEFVIFLENNTVESNLSLFDMIADGNEIEDTNVIINANGIHSMKLKNTYFSYFNIIYRIENENDDFAYFTRYLINMSSGTIMNEFEIIVNKLIQSFGVDINGKGVFDVKEINGENWIGRSWLIDDTLMKICLHEKLCLTFCSIEFSEMM